MVLRAAVVGTGLIAVQKHLPAWQKVSSLAQVVALCDVDRQRAREIADRFGIPQVYDDLPTMLDATRPDIVDICTPPRTHAPLTIRSLEAGAHVLVEKPMAIDTRECDEMIAAAERAGRTICVGHSDLFYPSFLTMRRLVSEGGIGEFRGMRIFLSTPTGYITSREDHWANKLPGGVIGETGPHVVYMTLAFINPICEVGVHAQKLLPQYSWSPYEDYRIVLSGERHVSSITLTYATDQWAAQVDVWGTNGIIQADLESQSVTHTRRTALTGTAIAVSTVQAAAQMTLRSADAGIRRLLGRSESTHERLIRAFCESIRNVSSPPVTAAEGRESIRVMDLITQSIGS